MASELMGPPFQPNEPALMADSVKKAMSGRSANYEAVLTLLRLAESYFDDRAFRHQSVWTLKVLSDFNGVVRRTPLPHRPQTAAAIHQAVEEYRRTLNRPDWASFDATDWEASEGDLVWLHSMVTLKDFGELATRLFRGLTSAEMTLFEEWASVPIGRRIRLVWCIRDGPDVPE